MTMKQTTELQQACENACVSMHSKHIGSRIDSLCEWKHDLWICDILYGDKTEYIFSRHPNPVHMPNHVEQDLWVNGDVTIIKEFIEFAKENEDDILSANKFLPYPEEYRILDEQGKLDRVKGDPDCKDFSGCVQAKYMAPIKDGFNSGRYDWCRRVWGTKWGCYDATISIPITFGNRKKGTVLYKFKSAWDPAVKIIVAMSQKFSTLKFKLKYYERGMEFKGEYIVCGGEVLKDIREPYHGSRGG